MLTFEEILEAFRKHLDEDDSVEVVHTRHGYTVLDWDDGMEDWARPDGLAGGRASQCGGDCEAQHGAHRRGVTYAGSAGPRGRIILRSVRNDFISRGPCKRAAILHHGCEHEHWRPRESCPCTSAKAGVSILPSATS